MELTHEELIRYQRHLTLPEVGVEGQKKLKNSSVLLIGAGGLGSPLALYLTAAGVGRIGIVDFDYVDQTNLQRQILHGTSDVGRPKLESARDRLKDINPNVRLHLHELRLSSENAIDLFREYDVVADGTDNFPTRYLVNDACVLTGTPNAYASIYQFEGQASVFSAEDGPCYRCLYPEPPPPGLVPSCAEGGVLGILPGLMGTIQATEVIKLLLGIGEPLVGRLLLFDALEMSFRTLKVRRNPDCPVCGDHPTVTELIDYEQFCGIPGQPVHVSAEEVVPEVTVQELKHRRDSGSAPFLLDVRKPFEDSIATLRANQLIPHDQLADRLSELKAGRDDEIVVHCRSGVRSAQAVEILQHAGYSRVYNLAGGIKAWSREIDPSVPEY
ncbi:MAG TPA: molybdopterin-synthase adenylyltransferase MoeB [Rhodothermales bacterium]|nr:molybdopterin-synthase adenylyltransferase MoeB [Rhodothermales bacterium]